jgi:hypothetical protein
MMMLVSAIAEATTTQSGSGSSSWLLPLITAGATLLGAVVGGLITYWNTRSTDDRKAKAEQERLEKEQIRDVSVRFLSALSDLGID